MHLSFNKNTNFYYFISRNMIDCHGKNADFGNPGQVV